MRIQGTIDTPRFQLKSLDATFVGENYKNWLVDPEVNQYLETRFFIQDDEELIAYVSNMLNSTHSYLFAVVDRESNSHIGNIKLGPINPWHSSAPIGLVVGESQWWGKGVAKEIIAALSNWAFEELGLYKLNAGSYSSNIASIKAFLSCGFSEEGRQLSQVEINPGVRDDVVLLGKVNPTLKGNN